MNGRILSTAFLVSAVFAAGAWASSICGMCISAECTCHAFSNSLGTDGSESLDSFRTFGSGWTSTSSGPSSLGEPATLTWSIVPDGANLPTGLGEPSSPNNLISFLDGIHHGGESPGETDLTQRDWFPLIESSFKRWDQVSGISFNYEPNDDGAVYSSANRGILGVRGDHRIGGHSIDGQISPTFLAYNYFPNHSDMVIDTDEIDRWGNPEDNFIRFRNMLMHEAGHGLGLKHLDSSDADFLMEPFLATTFDGPQLDDILGMHRLYGDANEENGGNDTYETATPLGRFRPGKDKSFGVDAADSIVDFGDIDFLSIDDESDVDFFTFRVKTPSLINLTLTPLGPAYQEGLQGGAQSLLNTAALSDLMLTLFDTDGQSILEFANNNGSGEVEEISDFRLFSPGDYFVEVSGIHDAAQFYQLDIDVDSVFPRNPFRFFDRLLTHDPFGHIEDALSNIPFFTAHLVPEPSSGLIMVSGIATSLLFRRRRI